MFSHSLRIGKVFGIDIWINWSWLIIFILITWSLATAFFPATYPEMSTAAFWIVAVISTVLLFVSVLLHELGHSVVAKREGIPVHDITLFVFGGVSDIEQEPSSWSDELKMAIAGPAISLMIGIVSWILLSVFRTSAPQSILATLFALFFYNIALAIFNMIPGFPLDGGRVFRAIVWGVTGSLREATTIATAVGHVFAYLFIFGGLFLALAGDFLSGIWLVFIGWFLNTAASASQQQVQVDSLLRGATVSSAMQANPTAVPASTSVHEFVEHYVLGQNLRALPVVSSGNQLAGLITLADARAVSRIDWDTTAVDRVMRRSPDLTVATPDEPLSQALKDLSERNINQMPVVRNGELVGMLTRADIIHYMQVREEVQRAA